MSGPDIERVDVVPSYDDGDLDPVYVDRLCEQTKVDRGSVALVLGQHLANQHQAQHARPGRPRPFPVNMSRGTVADAPGRTPLTDEEFVVLARESEGL